MHDDGMLSLIFITQDHALPPWLDSLAIDSTVTINIITPDAFPPAVWPQPAPHALLWQAEKSPYLPAVPDTTACILITAKPLPHIDQRVDLIIPPVSHALLKQQIQHAVQQRQQINQQYQRQAEHQRAMHDLEIMKNTIVHNVTHELNTPLLQVKSAVALIAEDMAPNSLADYAQRATARLEGAIQNITQLAASLDDLQTSPLVVHEIISAALRGLGRTWEDKKDLSRVQRHIAPGLPPMLGDRQGITIVLQQLIDNALKFSSKTVEIHAQADAEHIHLSVTDYGIGIATDDQTRILDAFYQIDSQSTRQFSGIGVGLTNVRLILERHNTQINIASKPGDGSTFSFRLPIAQLN